MKKDFIISNRDGSFERAPGIEVNNGLFIYNGGAYVRWVIADIASGTSVKTSFRTLAEAKDFADNIDEDLKAQIETIRNTQEYKNHCAKVAQQDIEKLPYNESLKEAYSLSIVEAFNVLDREDKILSIFSL